MSKVASTRESIAVLEIVLKHIDRAIESPKEDPDTQAELRDTREGIGNDVEKLMLQIWNDLTRVERLTVMKWRDEKRKRQARS